VQFARKVLDGQDYAIKFFVSREAFQPEAGLYLASPLGKFLPVVKEICDNDDGGYRDAQGHSLPPFIVMERGESLDQWMRRAHPDKFQTFGVCAYLKLDAPAANRLGSALASTGACITRHECLHVCAVIQLY
jgi:hypothetical protein